MAVLSRDCGRRCCRQTAVLVSGSKPASAGLDRRSCRVAGPGGQARYGGCSHRPGQARRGRATGAVGQGTGALMYRVLLRPSAQKFLRKLRDKTLTARLVTAMRSLVENPRYPGSEKLADPEDLYRVR